MTFKDKLMLHWINAGGIYIFIFILLFGTIMGIPYFFKH
jgi:hypothetical protein